MHDAIRSMLDQYDCQTHDEYVNALRQILQELALLGLWRSKFFEHAAFLKANTLRQLILIEATEDLLRGLHPGKTLKIKLEVDTDPPGGFEARMRQSGDYQDPGTLTSDRMMDLLRSAISQLDVEQVRAEVTPFVRDKRSLDVWSRDFFHQVAERLAPISP